MPSAHESDGALDDLVDPELPTSTYVLEPEAVAPLVARVATSHDAGTHRPVHPFTGAPLTSIPLSSAADVAAAVRRARVAQRAWARVPVRERAAVLDRLGALVLERQSEILDLVQMESGKARRSAFEEVGDVAQVTRHYAVRGPRYLVDRRVPGMMPLVTGVRVHRRPVGVVGVVAAWNYPLTLALADAVPALLAGDAVVLKPDPQTTLSALWVAEQLEDAGLPADLFTVVAGGGEVGEALVDHVDHVAFTGSTATGRAVAARAGARLVGTTLELGGKNPLYVAADADLASAVRGAVRACFSNAGQLCLSVERLVLHEAVADAFLERFVAAVKELRLGPGLDYSADVGSLVSQAQLDRVTRHVDDALARGARALAGAVHRPDVGPYFYAPTVLDDVPADALVATEETFGPVVTVTRVASDDDAVRVMNDTQYGLNASIWSVDVARARRIAARVEAGTVVINDGYGSAWGSVAAPMGGVKASGLGRRHGREAIEAVTEAQTVAVQRGARFGVALETVYAAGGETPSQVVTGALRALRRLRLP
ncbi:succinic semialdehyde dehydrogenase [Isoptericola variabilis]|uniref:Succinate-semialdehyde dehydrogenase (NAD(P)(+)) n=1 Tax=Isoptericola variabilis (strain 225) TaxID=743718 RepID=F6FWT7_ISOV2|nr:succinic semialdehyde dehydrogenase [Isoptericola variabilis]AEG43509.1 Succinate-semialdehyde dehydrogenase (NAD(P)(+)) [Isoptericola variabilis 225]